MGKYPKSMSEAEFNVAGSHLSELQKSRAKRVLVDGVSIAKVASDEGIHKRTLGKTVRGVYDRLRVVAPC